MNVRRSWRGRLVGMGLGIGGGIVVVVSVVVVVVVDVVGSGGLEGRGEMVMRGI